MLRFARNDRPLAMPSPLTITALTGVPLVKAGDDLAAIGLAAYSATARRPMPSSCAAR